jgi:hypothetical protein
VFFENDTLNPTQFDIGDKGSVMPKLLLDVYTNNDTVKISKEFNEVLK